MVLLFVGAIRTALVGSLNSLAKVYLSAALVLVDAG
jgi:hypothetical protein